MRILAKLIPFTFLLCLICYGISIIFGTDITYLQKNALTNGTIYYTFNFNSYVNNIDIGILKRATTNIIDIKTFESVVNSFRTIWANGYNFGDIFKTIANALILILDSVITLINIVITPVRIIAGLLLTALSLLGININSNGAIITLLNNLLDVLAVPSIQPFM